VRNTEGLGGKGINSRFKGGGGSRKKKKTKKKGDRVSVYQKKERKRRPGEASSIGEREEGLGGKKKNTTWKEKAKILRKVFVSGQGKKD